MRYVCSHCHARFEAEPEEPDKECPSCKAEAGLEPVKEGTPPAMRYFGVVLAIAATVTIGGVVAGIVS
jgi:hypothetical protein